MSKLSKAIDVVLQGRAAPLKDFNFTEVTTKWSPIDVTHKKYEIYAKLGASVILSADEDQISNAVEAVRRAVIEEIFGEFRAPISELRVALYQADLSKARDLLAKLELKMFHE